MKRFLLLLLMCLLPMQMVWAGIDGAWADATPTVASAQPHHAHEYAPPDLTHADASADHAGDDPDCDYCHHSVFSILFLAFHFDCAPGRLDPPRALPAHYHSFIADISHPPDIQSA
jgi:hypothetical protein